MKSAFVFFAGIILLAGQVFGADDALLKSQKDKVSYTIGVFSGNNMKQQSIDIDPDIMLKGVKDSLSGGKTLLTDQEMRDLMAAFQKERMAQQAEKRKALAEKNKKEGEAFLAENKKKEGVTTLPSGLQYQVLRKGSGKSPKATDAVAVHYRGTLINGTEFDSSYQRNEPANVRLDSVIKGWAEALPLMKENAKWRIFIPTDLAYGENGAGIIEPNATLIFEVELISVSQETVAPSPTKPGEKSSKPAAESTKSAVKSSKPAAGK